MLKSELKKEELNVIATHCVCNGYSVLIHDIIDGEIVLWSYSNDSTVYESEVDYIPYEYSEDGISPAFDTKSGNVFLNECLRV